MLGAPLLSCKRQSRIVCIIACIAARALSSVLAFWPQYFDLMQLYKAMCIFYWIHWLLNGLLSPLHFCRCRIFSDLCLKVLTEATLVWSFFRLCKLILILFGSFLFLDSCSSLAVSPFLFSFSFHYVLSSPLWCKVKKVSLEPFFHLAYPSIQEESPVLCNSALLCVSYMLKFYYQLDTCRYSSNISVRWYLLLKSVCICLER